MDERVRASGGRREALRGKYLSLGLGELAAGAIFLAVAVFIAIPRLESWTDTAALWAALIPLLIIVAQAGVFWLSARTWVERTHMPTPFATFYRVFRVVDVGLLATGLLGVLVWLPAHGGLALTIIGVWIFGVIEYVNYFVVRLAYPIRRWSSLVSERRRPQLMQDIAAAHPMPPRIH